MNKNESELRDEKTSYNSKPEKESISLLKNHGYYVPDKEKVIKIINAFNENNIDIDLLKKNKSGRKGFDLIKEKNKVNWDSNQSIFKNILIIELKSIGKKRKIINEKSKGAGFTFTEFEEKNAKLLGEKYKVLIINLFTKSYQLTDIENILNNKTNRIYKTYSVFLETELSEEIIKLE